jgi:hypothetical protein
MPSQRPSLTNAIVISDVYGNAWWRESPPDIQNAFTMLGWNETGWDEGISPPTETMSWNELTPEMQDAASYIGYAKETWDIEEDVPDAALSHNITSSNETASEYYEHSWTELPQNVKAAAKTLGWSQSLWDSGGTA